MRILLTGFEPFADETMNPTALLMKAVGDRPSDFVDPGDTVRALVLPVSFSRCFELVANEIRTFDPEVVIAFGLAAGRSDAIEIERVAINCIDAAIDDNDGARWTDRSIDDQEPRAHFATLPIRKVLAELGRVGISAKISNSAGTYVCNYLFFRLLAFNGRTLRRTGFVHVPFLPEQAALKTPRAPCMDFQTLQRGLRAILKALK